MMRPPGPKRRGRWRGLRRARKRSQPGFVPLGRGALARQIEKRAGTVEFARTEQPDAAVLPVVPGILDDLARRSRVIASVSGDPPMRANSSAGTSRRIASSGPKAATSRTMTAFTLLLFGPTERISLMISASGTRLLKSAASSGR